MINLDSTKQKIAQSKINEQPFEYIVIDGASTDDSVEVIKDYKDNIKDIEKSFKFSAFLGFITIDNLKFLIFVEDVYPAC